MSAWPCVACPHEVHGHRVTARGWKCTTADCTCRKNPIKPARFTTGDLGYSPDIEPDEKPPFPWRRVAVLVLVIVALASLALFLQPYGTAWADGKAHCDEAVDHHVEAAAAAPDNATRQWHEEQALRYAELEAMGNACRWWKP